MDDHKGCCFKKVLKIGERWETYADWLASKSVSFSKILHTLRMLVEWCKKEKFLETSKAWGLRLYILANWELKWSSSSGILGSCRCADSVVSNVELLLQPFTRRGGRNRRFVFSRTASFHRACRSLAILNLLSLIWLSLTTGSKHIGGKAPMQAGMHVRVLAALLLQEPTSKVKQELVARHENLMRKRMDSINHGD